MVGLRTASTVPSSDVVTSRSIFLGGQPQPKSVIKNSSLLNTNGSASGFGESKEETQKSMDVGQRVCSDLINERTEDPEEENVDIVSNRVYEEEDENSCTLVISNVHSLIENEIGPYIPPAALTEVEVGDVFIAKKEVKSLPLKERRFSRTRWLVYRGVQIFRVRDSSGNSLQCGVCQIMFPITNVCYPGTVTYESVTRHILTEHDHCIQAQPSKMEALRTGHKTRSTSRTLSSTIVSNRPAKVSNMASKSITSRRPSSRSRFIKFSCRDCNEKFPSKFLVDEHYALVHFAPSTRKAWENPSDLAFVDRRKPIRGVQAKMRTSKLSRKNCGTKTTTVTAKAPVEYVYVRDRNGKKIVIGTKICAG